MTIDLQKKPDPDQAAEFDDGLVGGVPGQDLAVRADDDLELLRPSDLVPYRPVQTLVVRARQATARGWVLVVDQPVVVRAAAVGKQSPRVAAHLAGTAPKGVVRAVARLDRYLRDPESLELMARCAEQQDAVGYEKAANAREKKNLPGRRRGVLGGVLVALVLALAWWAPQAFAGVLTMAVLAGGVVVAVRSTRGKELLWALALAVGLAAAAWYSGPWLAAHIPQPPTWVWWTLAGISVPVLGWLGRDRERPLVQMPASMAPRQAPPITAPMIVAALFRIGVAGMTPAAAERGMRDEVQVQAPGVGRALHGWQINLELPPGNTAGEVADKREELAGALRRPLGCVWPSGGGDHPGHLRIYIGDKPMATAPQTVWPLADGRQIDIFDPFPMFTDEEGRWVTITLDSHVVIAGASGYGKSVTGRQLACAIALDPRVKVILFDGKISGDFSPTQKICHAYHEGVEPDDLDEQLKTLDWLEKEARRRSRFLRDLPPEERSPKVTSALASRYPEDLGPIVAIFDEVQEYTEYGDKTIKAEKQVRDRFRSRLTTLARIFRSAGGRLVFITQKPDDTVLPSAIVANCAVRICHKVTGQVHNDQVMGTGSYKAGVNAALFTQNERGLAWLRAEGDPRVVRSWSQMTELDVAEELIDKAFARRKALGLLTGQAADDGIEDAEIVYDLVADAEQVMRQQGRGKAQWAELVEWLRELRGQWAELTEEGLSTSIRAAGISPRDVRSGAVVRKGVYISDLRKRGVDDDDE